MDASTIDRVLAEHHGLSLDSPADTATLRAALVAALVPAPAGAIGEVMGVAQEVVRLDGLHLVPCVDGYGPKSNPPWTSAEPDTWVTSERSYARVLDGDGVGVGRFELTEDADLVAAFRTAAPRLAAFVLAIGPALEEWRAARVSRDRLREAADNGCPQDLALSAAEGRMSAADRAFLSVLESAVRP